jgi:hypothetical protein
MPTSPRRNAMWAVEIGTAVVENSTVRTGGENPATIEVFMEKRNIGTQIRKKKKAKRPDPVDIVAKRKIITIEIIKREISTTYKNGVE